MFVALLVALLVVLGIVLTLTFATLAARHPRCTRLTFGPLPGRGHGRARVAGKGRAGRAGCQASICFWPLSVLAMAILRGLACSAIGIFSVNMPAS